MTLAANHDRVGVKLHYRVLQAPHGSGALCAGDNRINPHLTCRACVQGPAVQVVRRHSRSSDAFRYAPAMTTVSGNYVAARRMGVVDGVDFGLTGMVRARGLGVVSIQG